jgi:spore coat polysaccharide biosynthesis protein SpsF
MMKSAIFIAVRMKSTRLPKKALLEIKGRTVIEHLIDRLKTVARADLVVVCTSTNPNDAILKTIAERNGIIGFQGSEDDKLDRFLQAADTYGVDRFVAVDGDDILCDPEYVDKGIQVLDATGADMVDFINMPVGATGNGLKVEALRKVCELKAENDTEVWGGYFTDSGLFKVVHIEPETPNLARPEIRMTLDYAEDFAFFEALFDRLCVPGKVFGLHEIVALLEREPELMDINREKHREYLKGFQEKARKIRLKKAEDH